MALQIESVQDFTVQIRPGTLRRRLEIRLTGPLDDRTSRRVNLRQIGPGGAVARVSPPVANERFSIIHVDLVPPEHDEGVLADLQRLLDSLD